MTIYGRSEELVSRCVECDLAEPESLASLGGSAPGVVDGIVSPSSACHHRRFIIAVRPILTTVSLTLWPAVDVDANQFFCRMHIEL